MEGVVERTKTETRANREFLYNTRERVRRATSYMMRVISDEKCWMLGLHPRNGNDSGWKYMIGQNLVERLS